MQHVGAAFQMKRSSYLIFGVATHLVVRKKLGCRHTAAKPLRFMLRHDTYVSQNEYATSCIQFNVFWSLTPMNGSIQRFISAWRKVQGTGISDGRQKDLVGGSSRQTASQIKSRSMLQNARAGCSRQTVSQNQWQMQSAHFSLSVQ